MPKCDTCAISKLQNGGCPVFRADMSGKDGCPLYQYELQYCDICGGPIIGTLFWEHDDNMNWHKECQNCINAPRCKTCVHQYCAFKEDTHCPEPFVVMREVRQGNMIMQTQVMNPKRVEATCRQGCPCFNEDGLDDGTFCNRENECGCNKYNTNWRN